MYICTHGMLNIYECVLFHFFSPMAIKAAQTFRLVMDFCQIFASFIPIHNYFRLNYHHLRLYLFINVFLCCHAHVYTIYFRVTVSRDFNTSRVCESHTLQENVLVIHKKFLNKI